MKRNQTLVRQLALTEALWSKLTQQGLVEGSRMRVDGVFFAPDRQKADALAADLGSEDDWSVTIGDGNAGELRVRVRTRPLVMGPEVFAELTKIMVASAEVSLCEFDGFEVEMTAVKRKKPWWRIF